MQLTDMLAIGCIESSTAGLTDIDTLDGVIGEGYQHLTRPADAAG